MNELLARPDELRHLLAQLVIKAGVLQGDGELAREDRSLLELGRRELR
jgi:hypothetical protein